MSHLLFSVLYGPNDPNDVTRIIKAYHKSFFTITLRGIIKKHSIMLPDWLITIHISGDCKKICNNYITVLRKHE